MRFLDRFRRKKFHSITTLQPHTNKFRFLITHKKQGMTIRKIHQTYHTNNIYQMRVTLSKQELYPMTNIIVMQGNQQIQQKMIIRDKTWTFPMMKLQHISDELLARSIQKEKMFYKYHPSLAAKLAMSIFSNTPYAKHMQTKQRQPFLFQMLPQQIIHEDVPMRLKKVLHHEEDKEEKGKAEERKVIQLLEYRKIVEDVCIRLEKNYEKERRRKGR